MFPESAYFQTVGGRGKVAAVDLGLADQRRYVNVVTMGLGAEVIKSGRQVRIATRPFGNIHLGDARAWYEERVVAHGLRHHEPLWGDAPSALLEEFIDRGYSARLVSIDTMRLPAAWLGRDLDAACAADLALRPDVDPCGERGEYHTLVTAGPLFRRPLSVRPGVTHADGPFLLLDMEPRKESEADGDSGDL
ncbi:MAG: hypothetical protein ACRDIE_06225 [Chloroflexota bacterium]